MAVPPFLPDEAKPADADILSQYPAVERLFRDIVESWLLIDHDTDGEHDKVTMPERADPSNVSNTGILYTKDDGGDTELFYIDDSGNVVQITADGALTVLGVLDAPATTSMLFYQSAAPTGWTKDTNATLNNHAIRVVTSTGWTTGSNGATAFDSVFGSGKTAGAHTLLTAEMPAHVHTILADAGLAPGGGQWRVGSGVVANTGTESAGGGGSHDHTLSLDLNYLNVIRATKD